MDPQHPEAILQRLEELRRWQQEQQDALHQKQIAQRDLLNMEQQKLYEMFGLSMSSSISGSVTLAERTAATAGEFDESHQELIRNLAEDISAQTSDSQAPATRPPVAENIHKIPNRGDKDVDTAFTKESHPASQPAAHVDDAIPKRKFLKRGEGLSNRFGVHPDELRLGNLPKYKYAGAHRQSKFFKSAVQKIPVKPGAPARVPWSGSLSITEEADADAADLGVHPLNRLQQIVNPSSEPKTWAKSLTTAATNLAGMPSTERSNFSMQSTPIRNMIREQQAEIDELDDFERAEHDQRSVLEADTDADEVAAAVVAARDGGDTESDDDTDNECDQPRRPQPVVRFHNQVLTHQTVESDSETLQSSDMDEITVTDKTSTPTMPSAFRAFKAKLFRTQSTANQHHINESTINDDNTPDVDDDIEPAAAPLPKQPPQSAPAVLLPTTVLDQTAALKDKLAQLEHEIALFRSQNVALTAVAQQHELDRIALAEERADHEARLADERARFEVQMHDERMRLGAEREALERRARELRGPNRKEREETVALRERVDQLERDAASKEQRHVAAQARLRAQLRTMEKDLKEFSFEVDQQRKENKKLESENVRLRRQSNNKMLNEINRNIAKLSVVVPPTTTTTSKTTAENNPKNSTQRTNKTLSTTAGVKSVTISARSRTRSVPNLLQSNAAPSSSSSSDSESDVDEAQQSNYFKPAQKSRARSSDNANAQVQTDHVLPERSAAAAATSDFPPTATAAAAGKREIVNADGSRDILYPNGNLKKVSADSMRIRMLYFNKDIQETNVAEGTVKYYYAETNTWQTSYLDGLDILEFPK